MMCEKTDRNADLRYEELNGEIVVLDAGAGVVHRLSGEAAETVRAETDEVSRRRVIGSLIALGVAAGVTTLALPSAAAAASGGGDDPALGSNYSGYAGDPGVSAPTGVSAEPGDASVTVLWDDAPGATGYRVYVRVSGQTIYTLAWKGTGTTATVSPLMNGTTYEFIVVAVQNLLVSAQSASASAAPSDALPPNAPTNLRASIYVSGEIWLYWDAPVGGPPPASYQVQHRVSGAPTWTASGTTTATDLLFSSLARSTPYEFRVRSVLAGKYSPWSSIYSATTQ